MGDSAILWGELSILWGSKYMVVDSYIVGGF